MSDNTELLAQLRDIRLPPATPVPALWPLLVTVLLALIALIWIARTRWQQKNAWASEVQSTISVLQSEPADRAIPGYAALLKRTVLTIEPAHATKTLHGEPWLHQLDRFFRTDFFSNGEGRVFGDCLYQPVTMQQADSEQLGHTLKQLVRKRSFRIFDIALAFKRTAQT